MAISDPIADMLTRIRNAIRNRDKTVVVLNSRVCRPLDKPLIPKRDSDDQRAFDDVADEVRESVGETELGTIY